MNQQLRKAREDMQSIFPLSIKLWIQWLSDEIDHSKLDNSGYTDELFEKALIDQPYSTEIWLKYLQYSSIKLKPLEMRELFERAVNTAGYDLINGSQIFDYLGEYLLSDLNINNQTHKFLDNNEDSYLSDIYAIRLKIPHLEATLTAFDKYEILCQKLNINLNLAITQLHTKVIDIYTLIEPYMQKMVDNPNESNFRELVDILLNNEDCTSCPNVLSIIEASYEYFLTYNDINADLWKNYISVLSGEKIDNLIRLNERALRFVPWDILLWCSYLQLIGEKSHTYNNSKFLTDALNKALNIGFNCPEQYLILYQYYISYFIRYRPHEEILKVFDDSIDFFIKNYGNQSISLMQIYKLKGDYLLFKAELPQCYIEFWDSYLINECDDDYTNYPAFIWLDYIKQLVNLDLLDKALSIYNIALTKVNKSELQYIVAALVNFKIIHGNDDGSDVHLIDFSNDICNAMTSIVQNNWLLSNSQLWVDKPRKKLQKKYKDTSSKSQKRDITHINIKKDSITDSDGFKVPLKAPKLSSTSKDSNSLVSTESDSCSSVSLKKLEKIPQERKEKTVFLSNLAFDANEEDIHKVFANCGDIMEIRLVKSRTERSKGFGYLEFVNRESISRALSMDRTLINNRPVYVSPCIDKSVESLPFKFNTELSENILYVNKLSKETTVDTIKHAFSQLSDKIKDIRLVTNRSGISKGYAYVEFYDSSSACKAILLYDGSMIDGVTISVAKSNPPKKKNITINNVTSQPTKYDVIKSNLPLKDFKNKNNPIRKKPRISLDIQSNSTTSLHNSDIGQKN